jgi:flagellar biosynthetic protein FliR
VNPSLMPIVLPFMLLLGRVSAFIAVLPIFSWSGIPMVVRVGLAMVITVFLNLTMPMPVIPEAYQALGPAAILMAKEVVTGLALGLAANFLFLAVKQAAAIMALQIGFGDAGVIDPSMGEEADVLEIFFEIAFAIFFLACDGHHFLLSLISKSYQAFPLLTLPDIGVLAGGLLEASGMMMLLALKLAAPLLASFVILSVVLGVLARVLPEMNILVMSYPLRVGMGLFLASAILPSLNNYASEFAMLMNKFLVT